MSIEYKYLPVTYDDTPLDKLCGDANNPHLPGGIIDKLVDELLEANIKDFSTGSTIYIPILSPFAKKYDNLVSKDEIKKPKQIERTIEEPVPIYKPEEKEDEEPKIALKELPPEPEVIKEKPKKAKIEDKEFKPTKGKLNYRLFPYTFSRPGETIEAVIRLYNDMSTGPAVIKKLVYEFTRENKDAIPPKLGQTVQVPVLLPFVYRHVNDNKIFKD